MVRSYHENVVDPFSSALGARYIERYEDLYIDEVLDNYLKNKKVKVIFIEMGVGTGRYLIRYGARLLNSEITSKSFSLPFMSRGLRSTVCKKYRDDRILRKYYSYDSYYDQNLQLLIGIDFQEQMIKRCKENLKEMKLYSLFGERILLCTAAAQYFNLAFDQFDEFKNSFKIVTCVFQTLGNQKEELQIELLKTLKRLASPKGIIIVSVFNKKMFKEFGLKRFYSIEVAPTVGELKEDEEALELRKKGILLTRQGVYSQWFSEEELKKVFNAAGLNVNIKSSNRLRIFDDHTQYIPKEKQEDVIKTLMIAESKVG
jgi:ubiquinone/menaquinone biosynthesis C-methylase UbiE